jgi:hypothetical protein
MLRSSVVPSVALCIYFTALLAFFKLAGILLFDDQLENSTLQKTS